MNGTSWHKMSCVWGDCPDCPSPSTLPHEEDRDVSINWKEYQNVVIGMDPITKKKKRKLQLVEVAGNREEMMEKYRKRELVFKKHQFFKRFQAAALARKAAAHSLWMSPRPAPPASTALHASSAR